MSKRVHFSPLNNVYELTQEKSSLKLSFFLPWWTNSLSRRKWRLWPGWENKFYQFLDLEAHLKHSSDNIQNGNRKSSDLMSFASFHWKEINIFHKQSINMEEDCATNNSCSFYFFHFTSKHPLLLLQGNHFLFCRMGWAKTLNPSNPLI